MRDTYGSQTNLLFTERDTEKGKERLGEILDILYDCDDEEVARKLFIWFDEEEDLLSYAGLQKFCHEKCKITQYSETSFRLEWYTYYDTPLGIWAKIAKNNRYIEVEGTVTRTFESQDGDDREREEALVIANGKVLRYEPPYGDEERYMEL